MPLKYKLNTLKRQKKFKIPVLRTRKKMKNQKSLSWCRKLQVRLHLSTLCAVVILPTSKGYKGTGNDSEQSNTWLNYRTAPIWRTTMTELEKGQSGREVIKEENDYRHFSKILSSGEQSWGPSVQSLQRGQGHMGWARFKAKPGRSPSRAHSKASLFQPDFNFFES